MNNKCKLNKKGLEYINNSESMIENNLNHFIITLKDMTKINCFI